MQGRLHRRRAGGGDHDVAGGKHGIGVALVDPDRQVAAPHCLELMIVQSWRTGDEELQVRFLGPQSLARLEHRRKRARHFVVAAAGQQGHGARGRRQAVTGQDGGAPRHER